MIAVKNYILAVNWKNKTKYVSVFIVGRKCIGFYLNKNIYKNILKYRTVRYLIVAINKKNTVLVSISIQALIIYKSFFPQF